jgi:mannose-6-phosphate isomerase class I
MHFIWKKLRSSTAIFFVEESFCPEAVLLDFLKKLNGKKDISTFSVFYFVITHTLNQSFDQKAVSLVMVYKIFYHEKSFISHEFILRPAEKFKIKNILKKNQFQNFYLLKKQKSTITVTFCKKIYSAIKSKFENSKILSTQNPYLLKPIFIPKPWGQEIWFTGVEKRGVSCLAPFYSPQTSFPIPWFFSALPQTFLGKKYETQNLVLVKILDPFPLPVFGDLYYELHTKKNEVYIVTKTAQQKAQIKIGLNPEKLKLYSQNIPSFKKDFLDKIQSYEKIRRQIDDLFDAHRAQEHLDLHAPVSPQTIMRWTEQLPQEIQMQEREARLQIDAFAGFLNLKPGDVVSVPILVPHALQHGVQVIEFQTPNYERLIISFAQKVLTQNHWDSQKAFELMKIEPPPRTTLKMLTNTPVFYTEEICSFPEFRATRTTIKRQQKIKIKALSSYQILFFLSGKGILKNSQQKDFKFKKHLCVFLPANKNFELFAETRCVFLTCQPTISPH